MAIVGLHLFLLLWGENRLIIGISKNLILFSLAVFWVWQTRLIANLSKWIFAALVFCFIGDLVLQFAALAQIYFIFGLVSFLAAHVCYILGFFAEGGFKIKLNGLFLKKSIVPILAGTSIFLVLWPHLGKLRIPVFLYTFVIAGMAVVAQNRSKVGRKSFILVAVGAWVFIISDAVLAYNKFVEEVPFASILIMSTYAVANFLLLMGLLQSKKTN